VFSERLKAARGAKGLTQQAVADHLGIKLAAYQHYEYNFRKPSFDVLANLCRFLQCSADWLLDLSEERELRP